MSLKSKILLFFIALFLIPSSVMYFIYGAELISQLYNGNAPVWASSFIDFLYPRFKVALHRFPLDFFIDKANQVVFRAYSVAVIAVVIFRFYNKKTAIQKYFSQETTRKNVSVLRVVFYFSLIAFTADWHAYLVEHSNAAAFYQPILIYKILHLPFPNYLIINMLWGFYLLAILLLIFNQKPVISAVVVAFLFFLMQGYFHSFEKINHQYATFGYASLLMPFLLYEHQKSKKQQSETQSSWALQLIQLCLCLTYFFAGLEKLFISKFTWFASDTFQSYLTFYATKEGLWLSQQSFLMQTLPSLVLLLQIGFIAIIFYPKLKWVFLPFGFLFHFGIYVFMGVGAYLHPWAVLYIFFLDWKSISRNLYCKWSKISLFKKRHFKVH